MSANGSPNAAASFGALASTSITVGSRATAARRPRVLIADDDEDIRVSLAEVLADEGWDVALAQDGEEALAWMMAETFAAVVLDHRMPKMTGGEAWSRADAAGHRMPVVLVTAASGALELAASLGIERCLTKPFQLDELLAILAAMAAR